MSSMNYLNAVFWDYPEFTVPDNVRKLLREEGNKKVINWVLQRFLEHGRVVDTLSFFSIQTISNAIPHLRITPYAQKKWKRIIEVYDRP